MTKPPGDAANGPQDLYTVRDVSRIFGLSESRIRYWAQTGIVNPSVERGGRRYYTFQDLIGIKTAVELLESGLSLQKVRKNLRMLRETLPRVEHPLSRLRIRSDGERVVVVSEDKVFEPESRQVLLDFRTGSFRDQVAVLLDLGRPVRNRTQPLSEADAEQPRQSAYRWFIEGLRLDQNDDTLEQAADAYRRALDLDPSLAAAHTNLGNIYHRLGRKADARAHYERALALDPDQPEARYNLANLHEQAGRLELAIAEYRRVVAACPEFPDAHFNLALALEQVGSRVQAAEHFRRYIELDGDKDGLWVKLARSHLVRLSESD